MKFFKFLLPIVLVISCSKPEENFIKIPSQFTVFIQEKLLSNGNRELWLELSSLNSEYCEDDSLAYQTASDLNTFSIEILDSYKANDCFQRNYFLKSLIKLPDFTDSLQIRLSLGLASIINLSVYNNKNDINIEIKDGIGLLKKYEKTHKIPKNLLWGLAYPKFIGPTSDATIIKFKKDIEYDCNNYHLQKGFYSYFLILDNNVLQLIENAGIARSSINFYFTHNKTEEELNLFFENLASEYVNLVGYKINCGTGKEFNSN